MTQPASAMLKETADNCRGALVPETYPELGKLLARAACDLEAAASIIFHNIEARARPLELQHPWILITDERDRQIKVEGWSAAHDDEHATGEMLRAAIIYLHWGTDRAPQMNGDVPMSWPWSAEWWKPKDRKANLVRAGALMVAERDRLMRKEGPYARTRHVDHKLDLVLDTLFHL